MSRRRSLLIAGRTLRRALFGPEVGPPGVIGSRCSGDPAGEAGSPALVFAHRNARAALAMRAAETIEEVSHAVRRQ